MNDIQQIKNELYEYYLQSYDSIRFCEGDLRKLTGWVKVVACRFYSGTSDCAITWEDICSQVFMMGAFEKWLECPSVIYTMQYGTMETLKNYLNRRMIDYATVWVVSRQKKRANEYNEATLSGTSGDEDFVFSVDNFPDESNDVDEKLDTVNYENTALWKLITEIVDESGYHEASRDDYYRYIKAKAENPKTTLENLRDELDVNLTTINRINNKVKGDDRMIVTAKQSFGYLITSELEKQDRENWTPEKLEARYGTPAKIPYCDGYLEQFKGYYRGSENPYVVERKTYKPGDTDYDELYNAIKNTPYYDDVIYYMQ